MRIKGELIINNINVKDYFIFPSNFAIISTYIIDQMLVAPTKSFLAIFNYNL